MLETQGMFHIKLLYQIECVDRSHFEWWMAYGTMADTVDFFFFNGPAHARYT